MSTVFISSTFKDMQFERDILQNNVLPRIKDFAKQYGKNIELCDLRWGVNSLGMSEEESSMKVLQVCFDEIDYARPFFIAILGDRYGWIPPTYISENIATDRGFSESITGKSVTELEIRYGALKDIDHSCVRFYFRTITNKFGWLRKKQIPAYFLSESSSEHQCIQKLKKDLKRNYPELCRDYNVSWNQEHKTFDGLESFANMLYEDLKAMIIQCWGELSELTEYEKQYIQYQYALSVDVLFEQCQSNELNCGIDVNKIWRNSLLKQIYAVISNNEYVVDKLFASLYEMYINQGFIVIPYDCGQSMVSGFLENMICYLTEIATKKFNLDYHEDTFPEKNTYSVKSLVERFHSMLETVDKIAEKPIVFAIRGLQYLDAEDILFWMPLRRYKNIRFIISNNQNIVGPTVYRELSDVFFLPKNQVFDMNLLITDFMKKYRKELDDGVIKAIINKSGHADFQYMELLMRRLLILSQTDFEEIWNHGDGIEKISEYLIRVIREAPDNLEDILGSQIELLYGEIGEVFTKAVLSILALLPYGISKEDLNGVLDYHQIAFDEISFTLLRRRLSACINETLNGYIRFVNSNGSNILKEMLWNEISEWSTKIRRYLDATHSSKASGSSLHDLYASQYLLVAQRADYDHAITSYLININRKAYNYNAALKRIMVTVGFNSWLKRNAINLCKKDIEWFVLDYYRYLSTKSAGSNDNLYSALLGIVEIILPQLEAATTAMSETEDNYLYFRALFMAGEITLQVDDDISQTFLKKAKEVSRKDFLQNSNRIWKIVHGIELTDEEKHRGYDYYEERMNQKVEDGVLFGFSGESEDFVSKQCKRQIDRV